MHINDTATHADRAKLERVLKSRSVKQDNGCIEWLGAKDPAGYGQIGIANETFKVHRVAWVLANGPIPDSGRARSLSICHTCDNRGCINTEHMFVGTDADNSDDKVRKNRQQKGESHPASKLTDEQVIAIRLDNRPVLLIAKEYGLSKANVYSIQRNETWTHVGVAVVNKRQHLRDTPGYVNPLKKPPREKPRSVSVLKKPPREKTPRKRRYTPEVVEAIRNSGETLAVLGRRYGLSVGTVHAIRTGMVAKDLPMPSTAPTLTRGRPQQVSGPRATVRAAIARAVRTSNGYELSHEDFEIVRRYINPKAGQA